VCNLAGVKAQADSQAELAGTVADRLSAADRASRFDEHRYEAVAGRLDFLAVEPLERSSPFREPNAGHLARS
jgi:hypothetical protein